MTLGRSSSDGMFAHDGGAPLGTWVERFFTREGALRLYECELAAAGGGAGAVLAVMHGYGEHCRRYDELARFLTARGHVVCCLDARGHGRSQGQRGYVRRYDDYVDDLVAFIARLVERHAGRPLFVLGHSNGGLIAARAVMRGLDGVRGLVLTGPLLGLRARHRPVPDAIARALSLVLPRLPLPSGLDAAELTHDLALREAHARDPWVHRVATPRWYWQATLAGRATLAEAPRLAVPLLVVQGQDDPIVEPALAEQLCTGAGTPDKHCIMRPGELHEVLNEVARGELFALIAGWLEQRAG